MPTRTVPLLPCSSIDEIRDFYLPLGFEVAYYQQRPNPCVALRRGDLDLQYFGTDGVVPKESYSTCLVLVTHRAAVRGLRRGAAGARERRRACRLPRRRRAGGEDPGRGARPGRGRRRR